MLLGAGWPFHLGGMGGVGVIIGTGIFVLTGQVAKDKAGPAVALVVHPRRGRVRARRALLRRVRLHGPGRGLGLHLLLRHARGVPGLDHRMGPHPGDGARRGRGVGGLVGLLRLTPRRRRGHDPEVDRRPAGRGRDGQRPRHLPRAGGDRSARPRHQDLLAGQRGGRRGQGGHRAGDLRRAVLRQGTNYRPFIRRPRRRRTWRASRRR